jgi:peptidoglycan hydrolase-like protein with peptidoglycan-binding domain
MRLVCVGLLLIGRFLLQETYMLVEGQTTSGQYLSENARGEHKSEGPINPRTPGGPPGREPIDPDAPGGARGDEENIQEIQQRLKAAGFDPGPVDGRLNPQTRNAIRAYQKAHGLRPTGTLDQPTYKSLMPGKPSGNVN